MLKSGKNSARMKLTLLDAFQLRQEEFEVRVAHVHREPHRPGHASLPVAVLALDAECEEHVAAGGPPGRPAETFDPSEPSPRDRSDSKFGGDGRFREHGLDQLPAVLQHAG